MSEPYLILHKVRGGPAFDVAERLELPAGPDSLVGEDIWIIPTSGHRAYPSWSKSLSELGIVTLPDTNTAWGYNSNTGTVQGLIPYPYDEPDHYACNDDLKTKPKPVSSKPKPKFTMDDL